MRDGWQCQSCGSSMNLQVHHIKKQSELGGDVKTNLIVLCAICHRNCIVRGVIKCKLHPANCVLLGLLLLVHVKRLTALGTTPRVRVSLAISPIATRRPGQEDSAALLRAVSLSVRETH